MCVCIKRDGMWQGGVCVCRQLWWGGVPTIMPVLEAVILALDAVCSLTAFVWVHVAVLLFLPHSLRYCGCHIIGYTT